MTAAAERIITMPDGVPEKTLGWGVMKWCAKYLRHPNGIRAGKRWQFTREQARFVLWFYAVDDTGDWIYRLASRRLAKGSGKSPFAAVMALVELLGPSRFSHFDDSVMGGCVGKPVRMPLVQIAAVSEAQTDNTMRHIRAMVGKAAAPELHRDYNLDVGVRQISLVPEGTLKVLTSSAVTQEGSEATFIVGDELEHWTPANGGIKLHATLMDNLSKSNSRMLETLNAWMPGAGSAGEQTFKDWCDEEDGLSKNANKKRILYDARMAPPDTNLADEESLRRGLKFVYADCPWQDVDNLIPRIWSGSARPDDSKRKYLNWPVASVHSWCDPNDWAQMANPHRRLVDGEEVVLFFDGSLSNDNTALVGCCLEDGHIFTCGVWAPGEGATIDVTAVDECVDRMFDLYTVKAFFADVREWEFFTKVEWPRKYKDQLSVWAVPSGHHPEPIAWDMRSKDRDFTQACELVEAEILRHEFTHDGDPMLTRHVHNAHRYEGRFGVTVRKESRASQNKIDAAVCMIGARMVYRRVLEDQGKKTKPRTNRAMFV